MFAAWRTARRCLRSHETRDGAVCAGLTQIRAHSLWRAARAGDVESAVAALPGLIGCGAGLTPAGDDILMGFLAGLRATTGGSEARQTFCVRLSEAVMAQTHRTNPISAAYLLNAAEGGFPEPLTRLAAAIARGGTEGATVHAAKLALSVGATSGADGVRGLLIGLAAWGRLPNTEHRVDG